MKKTFLHFSLFLIVTTFFLLPHSFVSALDSNAIYGTAKEIEYKPLITIPGATTAGQKVDPVLYVQRIALLAIGIGSILSVLFIVIAGVRYITSEAIDARSDAKKWIYSCIQGLVLLLVSFVVLQIINPDLVNFNISLGAKAKGGLGKSSTLFKDAQIIEDVNLQAGGIAKDYNDRIALAKEALAKAIEAGNVTDVNELHAEIDRLYSKGSEEVRYARAIHFLDTDPDLKASLVEKNVLDSHFVAEMNRLKADGASEQSITDVLAQKVAYDASIEIHQSLAQMKSANYADAQKLKDDLVKNATAKQQSLEGVTTDSGKATLEKFKSDYAKVMTQAETVITSKRAASSAVNTSNTVRYNVPSGF